MTPWAVWKDPKFCPFITNVKKGIWFINKRCIVGPVRKVIKTTHDILKTISINSPKKNRTPGHMSNKKSRKTKN